MVLDSKSTDLSVEREKIESKKKNFKFITSIIIIVIILVSFFVFDGIDYYDIGNGCFLSITPDPFNGSKSKIIAAVKQLRSNEDVVYNKICSRVKYIWERRCIKPLEDMDNPGYQYSESGGCYYLGSDVIFIESKSKQDKVETIAEKIKYSLSLIN